MCDVAQRNDSPRFQSPEARQRQILDAAAQLAVTDGLDEVSMADVARAAGIAKGSIYLQYRSRNDLIDALRADLWHKMLDEPTRLLEDETLTWTQRLDAAVEHLVVFSMQHEALYHAVFHATASHSDEPWTESRTLLRQLLAGGQQDGEFHLVDLDLTTDFLLHAYAGPCYHSDDTAHVTQTLQQLFRRAVAAET